MPLFHALVACARGPAADTAGMPPLPPVPASEPPAVRRMAWRAMMVLGGVVAGTLGPVFLALLLAA